MSMRAAVPMRRVIFLWSALLCTANPTVCPDVASISSNFSTCWHQSQQGQQATTLRIAAYTYATGSRPSPLSGALVPECRPHIVPGVDCYFFVTQAANTSSTTSEWAASGWRIEPVTRWPGTAHTIA